MIFDALSLFWDRKDIPSDTKDATSPLLSNILDFGPHRANAAVGSKYGADVAGNRGNKSTNTDKVGTDVTYGKGVPLKFSINGLGITSAPANADATVTITLFSKAIINGQMQGKYTGKDPVNMSGGRSLNGLEVKGADAAIVANLVADKVISLEAMTLSEINDGIEFTLPAQRGGRFWQMELKSSEALTGGMIFAGCVLGSQTAL